MYTAHIGIDDTDSARGMCTTYLATLIVQKLLEQGVRFVDYPNLIRLNPNIPWKTRGNAAVALRFQTENAERAFDTAKELLIANSEAKDGLADPGLVMHVGSIPKDVADFSKRALQNVIPKAETVELIKKHNMQFYAEGSRRGLIGAVAAIGNPLQNDHTYEIIAYREDSHAGKRLVDKESVIEMDRNFSRFTFNNYDEYADRVLICPHGPDPVLCGIRGEDPAMLLKAFSALKIEEPVERYMVFRSNQGTGEHLAQPIAEFKTYSSGFVRGVAEKGEVQRGGHVFFYVYDGNRRIKCACYEPAGELRKVVLLLIKGDQIEVGGGVRKASKLNPAVLNIEYLKVAKLAENRILENPICKDCCKRMKSEGKGKGFSCHDCGTFVRNKVSRILPRRIKKGLYLPPLHSQRHLTKPLKRYSRENSLRNLNLIEEWFRAQKAEMVRVW